jgi:hypothetical protein
MDTSIQNDEWIERDDDWISFSLPGKQSEFESIHSPDTTSSTVSNEASNLKDQLTCPICLEPYLDRTYLRECLHSFCFACAARWLRHHPVCPLCKQTPISLIYVASPPTSSNIQSESHQIKDSNRTDAAPLPVTERFVECTLDELKPPPRLPGKWLDRRSVYRRRLCPDHPPCRIKAERVLPYHMRRLRPFIERELYSLLGEELVDTIVINYVLSSFTDPPRAGECDRTASDWSDMVIARLAVYLGEVDARIFLREVMTFVRSGWDMNTYDRKVSYRPEDINHEKTTG